MNVQAKLINPRVITPRTRRPASAPPLDLEPATAYEAMTRQKVEPYCGYRSGSTASRSASAGPSASVPAEAWTLRRSFQT